MRGTLREPAMNKSALPRVLAVIVTTGAMVVGSVVLQAQSFAGSWPEHTVRIITPFSPGISVDVAARALADALAKRWKLALVLGAVQADKIKLLAVTNAVRTPAAPNVPTVGEAGYPEFTFGGFLGLFGPRDMPADLQERIATDARLILNEPEIQQRLTNVGLIARGTTPAEFATIMDGQRAKWSAIAREHKIEPQ